MYTHYTECISKKFKHPDDIHGSRRELGALSLQGLQLSCLMQPHPDEERVATEDLPVPGNEVACVREQVRRRERNRGGERETKV